MQRGADEAYPQTVLIAELLAALWRDYITLAPQAERIRRLLTERGELLRHDHLAFRTFAGELGASALARPFEAFGWRPRESYQLARQVRARCWRHADPELPKLLISELVLDELSPEAQAATAALLGQLPAGFAQRADLPWAGRPWQLSCTVYEALLAESEHAGWVAAFGPRVHHAAVDVGSLSTFPDLAALAAFLIDHGFAIDDARGMIEGSPAAHLERSATRADAVNVAFSDATVAIPSGHYELARRYPMPDGMLFQGFLATAH